MDQKMIETLYSYSITYGIKIVAAILILVIGKIAASTFRRVIRKVLTRAEVDETVTGFISNLVYYAIIAFAVVAMLSKFGVETASFVAILGAASFSIGLALQGSLANFASGVMILLFRPFKVGDFIDAAGVSGSVKSIELFTTTLATPDNIKIIVPNGKLFGDTISNFSAYDTRRIDLVVGIGYDSSIEQAKQLIEQIIAADNRIHNDPEPLIAVEALADSSVNLTVRVWVNRSDFLTVKLDLNMKIKELFEKSGVDIPYPQQVVHMIPAANTEN